jgi:hypothetical protein
MEAAKMVEKEAAKKVEKEKEAAKNFEKEMEAAKEAVEESKVKGS